MKQRLFLIRKNQNHEQLQKCGVIASKTESTVDAYLFKIRGLFVSTFGLRSKQDISL